MTKKIALIAFATVIMFAAPMCLITDVNAESSTNVVNQGEFDIYLQTSVSMPEGSSSNLNGVDSGWLKFDVAAYDACKAIVKLSNDIFQMDDFTYTINSTFDVELENEYGKYFDVDPNYGEISSYLDLSNTVEAYWHVWVYLDYIEVGQTTAHQGWDEIDSKGLGHYRPFNDYVDNHESANVALFYGTDAQAAAAKTTLPTAGTQSLVDVTQMKAAGVSAYSVTFTLKDASDANQTTYLLQNKVGYGSDIYAALKDVCASNSLSVEGNDIAGPYYSWLQSIGGKDNTQVSPWVPYWAFFNNNGAAPEYTSYVSGYYSPLDGGYFQTNSVLFTYGSGGA